MLRSIDRIELSPLQSAALGDPISRMALDLLERARSFLRGEPSSPAEVADEPTEKQEDDPDWTTLASLLRFLLRADWPAASRRRKKKGGSRHPGTT
jgi:hypothetical protein